MTLVSRRVVGAIAIAVVATLALSACAVPGQGAPGVAATYAGRVVTNQQVLDMDQAFLDLGTTSSSVGEPLTWLLLGPDLIAGAVKLGMPLTDAKANASAQEWIAYNQNGGTVTPAALELVRDLLAFYYLLTSTDGVTALLKAGTDAEAGVVASPRYGAFTDAQYRQTVSAGLTILAAKKLGPNEPAFAPFGQVSGFAGAVPPWVSGG
jgi:hypothetical protein